MNAHWQLAEALDEARLHPNRVADDFHEAEALHDLDDQLRTPQRMIRSIEGDIGRHALKESLHSVVAEVANEGQAVRELEAMRPRRAPGMEALMRQVVLR